MKSTLIAGSILLAACAEESGGGAGGATGTSGATVTSGFETQASASGTTSGGCSAVTKESMPIEMGEGFCRFPIPAPPPGQTLDLGKVNVQYVHEGGMPVLLFNVPGGASACGDLGGWFYDDPTNPTEILLCSLTCTEVLAAPVRVDVLFGCDTVVVPA